FTGSGEGIWKWVTGPEAGTPFSLLASPLGGQFANWAPGEPNNAGGEHYAEFYSGNAGRWNDLPNGVGLSYVVEYGGMPGDPVVELTGSVTINVQ
ncbi:MAG: lectin, partial [Candidatus Sericytochromatia bacterium]|nr:lectin [Candidatus Tanganyikabacteria bacterium]